MRLTNSRDLEKLKKKNLRNVKLANAINKLIYDLQNNSFRSYQELKKIRDDAAGSIRMDFAFSMLTFIGY
jgi:Txe/YoeB family toxin of Txe-Axe toxin-antitoxin module